MNDSEKAAMWLGIAIGTNVLSVIIQITFLILKLTGH